MSSLHSQDRASLCFFTFADGRRCRAPRQSGDLQFCSFHARKQAQAQAAEDIGRDAGYFFSGRYLSACDLNAALGRVFAATAQGHVKPKTASALAYLAQVMVQCIQITEREYAEAFGGDGWRKTISSSVNSNSDYLNPPQPQHQPPTSASQPIPASQHSDPPTAPVGVGLGPSPASSPAPSSPPSPCSAGFMPASSSLPSSTPVSSSLAPHAPVGAGFSPSPGSQSAATAASSTRRSTSAIQSSTAAQSSTQQPVLVPPAPAPSATPQNPVPASTPQTGPSGTPMLASLPPRNPAPPPGSRSH